MKRSRSGFSLAELLTVVAILAVLIAVAIPALAAVGRNLKMRELDDTAREIFLAAQNTLTARKADGTLSAPEGDQVEGQEGWYWLFDGATEFLLPDGAVEPAVAENHIAIWYNAASAMVLEVYYGEKNGSFASPGCDWVPSEIWNGDYSNNSNQSGQSGNVEELRAEKRIGYYDGTDLPRGAVEQLLPPSLEIVNGNELTVKVTVPKAGEYLTKGVTLTVTVEELNAVGVLAGTKDFTDLTYSASDGTYELVLDSLTEESQQFKNVCSAIQPGANIRVTAKLSASPAADGTKYLSASTWKETNSLFEMRTGDTVSVACARHLQNLKDGFSNFSCESAVGVKQTDSIDWPAGLGFRSIGNSCIASYSGGGLEIRGLNAGLFDNTVTNMSLKGIRIVNPSINGTGAVGALANTASGAVIDDCRVYATTIDPGTAGDQKENFTCLGTEFAVTGGTAGGLIGSAENCEISNSFAALSSVSGNTVGGLAGDASGCSITDCYATAENLSGTLQSAMFAGQMSGGSVTGCYAAGNIASSGGTVSGFANGSGEFFNSYCAVSYNNEDGTPTGTKPQYGFAAGSVVACAYLAVNTPSVATENAVPKSYEKLKTWGSSWKALSAAETHPYRAELNGQAYPFPGLNMPHYGSWPVQTVKGIKLYDSPDAKNEIQVILVPSGGTTTVWAEVDGGSADIQTDVPDSSAIKKQGGVTCEKDLDSGLTKITVKADKASGNEKNRITYIDMEAGGYKLRVVAIVYDVTITLTPSGGTGKDQRTGTSQDADGKREVGSLVLDSARRTGSITAALNVSPTATVIQSNFDSVVGKKGNGIELSTTKEELVAAWSKGLADGDPSVSFNGSGSVPVVEAVRDGSLLNVTGGASGTAVVIARWAMDEDIYATCEVKMKGARAMIYSGKATEGGTVLDDQKDYPYRLTLEPQPHEEVTLELTPKLLVKPPKGGNSSYTWKLYETNNKGHKGNQVGTTVIKTSESPADLTIPSEADSGIYYAELNYQWQDGEEKQNSSDYMYVYVYRKALRTEETERAYIKTLQFSDAPASLTAPEVNTVSLEQVVSADYPKVNQANLTAYVDGAANTRTSWSVWSWNVDTGTMEWTPVTGVGGEVPVRTADGEIRAYVAWNSNDTYISDGGGNIATGGSITVRAENTGDYTAKSFQLRAAAAEAGGSDGDAKKTVEVTIQPKLKITPRSATGLNGSAVTFTANREPAFNWEYRWSCTEIEGGKVQIDYVGTTDRKKQKEVKITIPTENTSCELFLSFGPFSGLNAVSSTFKTAGNDGLSEDKSAGAINADGNNGTNDYFLMEKGKVCDLEFSWLTNSPTGWVQSALVTEPENGGSSPIDIKLDGAKSDPLNTPLVDKTPHFRYYSINSEEYLSNDTKKTMRWKLKHYLWGLPSPMAPAFDFDFYVIGAELMAKRAGDRTYQNVTNSDLNLDMDSNRIAELKTELHFNQELLVGTPVYTWTTSDENLVRFTDAGSSEDGRKSNSVTPKIQAVKYSAATYYATVTCTVNVEYKTDNSGGTANYQFTRKMSVKVAPSGTVEVSCAPCVESDYPDKPMPLTPMSGENFVLITDSAMTALHGNETRLKFTAKLKKPGGDTTDIADLSEYYCNVYTDNSYAEVEIEKIENGALYVRLKATNANVSVKDLELTVEIGPGSKTVPIKLYSSPVVHLYNEENADITYTSRPVYLNDYTEAQLAAGVKFKFSVAAEPDIGQITEWTLVAPAGYSDQQITTYLSIHKDPDDHSGRTAIVTLKRYPDFRVVVQATNGSSGVGHALVFLPVDSSYSGSMTRRKKFDVLGA